MTLFGIRVPMWSVLVNAACVVAIAAACLERKRRDVDPSVLFGMWPWAILGGFLGAHIYYLLAASGGSELQGWRWLNIFHGTSVQGGLLGGAVASAAYLRAMRQRILPVFDACSPGGAAAQAVARLGCFAAGCCFGRPTRGPFGVAFHDPLSTAPRDVPLHPAQLYEAAGCLALAVVLHRLLRKKELADGVVFLWHLIGYGAIRFVVQFFRGDDADRLWHGLAHSQLLAFAFVAVCAILLRVRAVS